MGITVTIRDKILKRRGKTLLQGDNILAIQLQDIGKKNLTRDKIKINKLSLRAMF